MVSTTCVELTELGLKARPPDIELTLGPALCLAQGMYMMKETPLQLLFSKSSGSRDCSGNKYIEAPSLLLP